MNTDGRNSLREALSLIRVIRGYPCSSSSSLAMLELAQGRGKKEPDTNEEI
jgi:hypothetical protein